MAEKYIEHMIAHYERQAAHSAEDMVELMGYRGKISALRTLMNKVKYIHEVAKNKQDKLKPEDFDSMPDGEPIAV